MSVEYNILAVRETQFGRPGRFYRSWEGDEPFWTIRCRDRLKRSEIYLYGLDHGLKFQSLRSGR